MIHGIPRHVSWRLACRAPALPRVDSSAHLARAASLCSAGPRAQQAAPVSTARDARPQAQRHRAYSGVQATNPLVAQALRYVTQLRDSQRNLKHDGRVQQDIRDYHGKLRAYWESTRGSGRPLDVRIVKLVPVLRSLDLEDAHDLADGIVDFCSEKIHTLIPSYVFTYCRVFRENNVYDDQFWQSFSNYVLPRVVDPAVVDPSGVSMMLHNLRIAQEHSDVAAEMLDTLPGKLLIRGLNDVDMLHLHVAFSVLSRMNLPREDLPILQDVVDRAVAILQHVNPDGSRKTISPDHLSSLLVSTMEAQEDVDATALISEVLILLRDPVRVQLPFDFSSPACGRHTITVAHALMSLGCEDAGFFNRLRDLFKQQMGRGSPVVGLTIHYLTRLAEVVLEPEFDWWWGVTSAEACHLRDGIVNLMPTANAKVLTALLPVLDVSALWRDLRLFRLSELKKVAADNTGVGYALSFRDVSAMVVEIEKGVFDLSFLVVAAVTKRKWRPVEWVRLFGPDNENFGEAKLEAGEIIESRLAGALSDAVIRLASEETDPKNFARLLIAVTKLNMPEDDLIVLLAAAVDRIALSQPRNHDTFMDILTKAVVKQFGEDYGEQMMQRITRLRKIDHAAAPQSADNDSMFTLIGNLSQQLQHDDGSLLLVLEQAQKALSAASPDDAFAFANTLYPQLHSLEYDQAVATAARDAMQRCTERLENGVASMAIPDVLDVIGLYARIDDIIELVSPRDGASVDMAQEVVNAGLERLLKTYRAQDGTVVIAASSEQLIRALELLADNRVRPDTVDKAMAAVMNQISTMGPQLVVRLALVRSRLRALSSEDVRDHVTMQLLYRLEEVSWSTATLDAALFARAAGALALSLSVPEAGSVEALLRGMAKGSKMEVDLVPDMDLVRVFGFFMLCHPSPRVRDFVTAISTESLEFLHRALAAPDIFRVPKSQEALDAVSDIAEFARHTKPVADVVMGPVTLDLVLHPGEGSVVVLLHGPEAFLRDAETLTPEAEVRAWLAHRLTTFGIPTQVGRYVGNPEVLRLPEPVAIRELSLQEWEQAGDEERWALLGCEPPGASRTDEAGGSVRQGVQKKASYGS
mmetsp:Transcript_99648/g.266214  ORF Transcript_99648/g.266214 Transcript_99648/m.266214 type:complete len:1092 (+) Transcript_99648:16-3291(+)